MTVQNSSGQKTKSIVWRHRLVSAGLVLAYAAMLGAAYAAVPLYKLICQATGLNGTTQRVGANGTKILDRTVTIHFDANIGAGMPWQFKPVQNAMTIRIGETSMAYFSALNPTGRTVTGSARYNVTPEIAGRFFDKIQCFCFNEQTLKAGERVEMPVTFFVDPEIVNEPGAQDIHDITLSYTFYEVPGKVAPSATTVPTVKIKGS